MNSGTPFDTGLITQFNCVFHSGQELVCFKKIVQPFRGRWGKKATKFKRKSKAWALLTFPHARDLSVHFNLTLASPNPLSPPFSSPSPQVPFPSHQTTPIVKYVRAHLTNTTATWVTRCSSVTSVTQDRIWIAFSHPLSLFHKDSGSAPYVSLAISFPRQPLSTFAFLPPTSISSLIKMLPKK